MTPRILFAANLHWNAGSSHMLAEYAASAAESGCEVGVSAQLSRMDQQVGLHLPVIPDLGWATHLVLVFEGRQFLTEQQLDLCDRVPRQRRAVIDHDGHWQDVVTVGADCSSGGYPPETWRSLYRHLADLVLQPKLGGMLPPGAEAFCCFGMPSGADRAHDYSPAAEAFDLQYIGSNWWRWDSLTELILAAQRACPPIRRIRVCGRWWDADTCVGHEAATTSVPGWLAEHGVKLEESVAFGTVVREMSRSTVSPILIRPVLATMRYATPRMFETVASGSLPAIPAGSEYVLDLYGEEARLLLLGADPGGVLARMVAEPEPYRRVLSLIRDRLSAEFSYPRLLSSLIKVLG